jgi:hypothetical protein
VSGNGMSSPANMQADQGWLFSGDPQPAIAQPPAGETAFPGPEYGEAHEPSPERLQTSGTSVLGEAQGEKAASEPEQPVLFEKGEGWEDLWKDMPEYVSEDLGPFKSIYVHFENRQDMEAFAALIGQTVTLDTKMMWFPPAELGRIGNKRYVDKASVLYKDRQRPE